MIKNILKEEKGSITLFVLIAVIFFLAIAFTAYVSSINKSQSQDLEFEKIKLNYESSYTNTQIEDLYKNNSLDYKILKIGDYVNYLAKDGNKILCKVLYNDDIYGLQIVSVNPVCTVALGTGDSNIPSNITNDFEKAKYSYNNTIQTLNSKADEYRNPTYSDYARCIGSNPILGKQNEINYLNGKEFFTSTFSYISSNGYNNVFKNTDLNKSKDYEQLGLINARAITDTRISGYYWIASRTVLSYSNRTDFYVSSVKSDGNYNTSAICGIFSDNSLRKENFTYGLRTVFSLKSNIKLDKSNGRNGQTIETAYEIK